MKKSKITNEKIVVGKGWAFFLILGILLLSIILYGQIRDFTIGELNVTKLCFYIIFFVLDGLALFGLCFLFNRLCCVVFFDGKQLKRKGSIFGFKSIVEVQKINMVKRVSVPKDEEFYVLIDDDHEKDETERLKKESYIFIPCNEKGKAFISKFYKGDIPSCD